MLLAFHAGVLLSIVCPLLLAVWIGETQVSAGDEVGCTSKAVTVGLSYYKYTLRSHTFHC